MQLTTPKYESAALSTLNANQYLSDERYETMFYWFQISTFPVTAPQTLHLGLSFWSMSYPSITLTISVIVLVLNKVSESVRQMN
jgi:hypothetical protein